MTKRDDKVYLHHILDAIARIEDYCQGLTKLDFEMDNLVQDGVIRQMEIIGEAAKNLSEDLRDKTTDIPWQDITGMRDKLIHGYFGVDLGTVWETVQRDLPPFKVQIKKLLKEAFLKAC